MDNTEKLCASTAEIIAKIKHILPHEPACYTQQNWDDALMAMADTPDQLKDEGWHEAYDEIIRKRQTCTCKHEQIKEALKSLPTLKDELVKYDMTVDKNIPEDEHNDFPNLKKQCEHRVSAYLAHSKQG